MMRKRGSFEFGHCSAPAVNSVQGKARTVSSPIFGENFGEECEPPLEGGSRKDLSLLLQTVKGAQWGFGPSLAAA